MKMRCEPADAWGKRVQAEGSPRARPERGRSLACEDQQGGQWDWLSEVGKE